MSDLPKISESEWDIMKVVWASSGPISAAQIIEQLNQSEPHHPRTVKTLLNRLVRKGALGFSKDGREYLYRAKVSENACVRAESESFFERVFGGALHPMLVQLVQEKKLSLEEIKELKRILKAKERKE
jgi:BlaI family transcriptional regulator, penicillinase repressor